MYSILLVDDEPDLLAAWRLMLTGEGTRCVAQALECVRQRVPGHRHHGLDDASDGRGRVLLPYEGQLDLARVPILVHTSAPLQRKQAMHAMSVYRNLSRCNFFSRP